MVVAPPFIGCRSVGNDDEQRRLAVVLGEEAIQSEREEMEGLVTTASSPGSRWRGRGGEARSDDSESTMTTTTADREASSITARWGLIGLIPSVREILMARQSCQ